MSAAENLAVQRRTALRRVRLAELRHAARTRLLTREEAHELDRLDESEARYLTRLPDMLEAARARVACYERELAA